MAPAPDSDAQFKFLIACIKHSTAGKIDFGEVASECSIVSKGAAAKRYERLMKAHGITNNSGRAGSPSPSGPSTPTAVGSKSVSKSSSKKRKMAARGNDLDDEVKTEVKTEVKHEIKQNPTSDEIDDSHISNTAEILHDTTGLNTLMAMPERTYVGDGAHIYGDDDVLLVSERQRDRGAPMPPVAFFQQILPPPPENFYGFVDHPANNRSATDHLAPTTIATVTNATVSHRPDADDSLKALPHSEPAAAHWPHHRSSAFL